MPWSGGAAYKRLATLLFADRVSAVRITERSRGVVSLAMVVVVLRQHPWFPFCAALTAAPLVFVAVSGQVAPSRGLSASFKIVRGLCRGGLFLALCWQGLADYTTLLLAFFTLAPSRVNVWVSVSGLGAALLAPQLVDVVLSWVVPNGLLRAADQAAVERCGALAECARWRGGGGRWTVAPRPSARAPNRTHLFTPPFVLAPPPPHPPFSTSSPPSPYRAPVAALCSPKTYAAACVVGAAAVHWFLWSVPHPLFLPVHALVALKAFYALPAVHRGVLLAAGASVGALAVLVVLRAAEAFRVVVLRQAPRPVKPEAANAYDSDPGT